MSMPLDWHRDFFTGLCAEFWHSFASPVTTRTEVDFVLRQLAVAPGAAVLDVPCGDCRHAEELGHRGFAVTAVDGSATMLALGGAPGANVHRYQLDMRTLPWRQQFAGAMCLGNSFGYLGDEGDVEFLQAVQRALVPGGRFLLDAANLETLLPVLVPRRWYEAGGIHFLSEVRYDAAAGVVRSDYTLLRGAEREQRSAWLRVRSCRETLALLQTAGFAEVRLLGPDGAPFQHGAPRAWFLATRPG